jgi:hypothetical protein
MFGEAMMVESWDIVGTAVTAGTHTTQEGACSWCVAHTGGEISVGTLQARRNY